MPGHCDMEHVQLMDSSGQVVTKDVVVCNSAKAWVRNDVFASTHFWKGRILQWKAQVETTIDVEVLRDVKLDRQPAFEW